MKKVKGIKQLLDGRCTAYQKQFKVILKALLLGFALGVLFFSFLSVSNGPLLNPRVGPLENPQPTVTPTPTPVIGKVLSWTGIASYYSEDGCIGCSPTLTMANGDKFKDEGKTVAFNKLPLGSLVQVLNKSNDMITTAEVTDRGGFESLGRIIDLSPAVKDSIGCSDLCEVEVMVKTIEVYQ